MTETALIEPRFRGPAGIGNGGYVAGVMAGLLGSQPVETTLRRGWPLGVPLTVHRHPDHVAALDAEGTVIAEAREVPFDLEVPPAPTRDEAQAATDWFLASPFSHSTGLCFVCGSAQPEGVGLRVFTGAVPGRGGIAAALWRPHATYADESGHVRPVYLWSALDCAGSFAFTVGTGPGRMLLGRMAGRLDGRVRVGEACIVMGWQIARDGRKLTAGTAIFGEDGGLRGLARALWVTPLQAT